MRILRTFLLTAVFVFSSAAESKTDEVQIVIDFGVRISIASKILGESRNLYVNVPDGYSKTDKRYPVLYVLDGGNHFNHSVVATQYLQKLDRIPELIIVAIPNNEGTRYRDLSLEKENFILFIKNEVMSYVDKSYLTTGRNTLFGSSSAGSFTIDLLSSEPELFENYIASSPFLNTNNSEIYKKFLKTIDEQAQEKSLYFSLTGQAEEGKGRTNSVNQFVDLLTEKPPKKLDWRYEFLANQAHRTTPYISMFNGLTHVFNSYQAPSLSNYKEYISFGGVQGIDMHYKRRAKIYGTDQYTPESTLLNVASMLLSDGQAETSLQIYINLTVQFPESAQSFSGMGNAYDDIKQYEKSILAHKKAINLADKMDTDWQDLFQNRLDKVNDKVSLLNKN